ncbi:hypothetical protein BXA18_22410, partial [Acinetobacter baumannii]
HLNFHLQKLMHSKAAQMIICTERNVDSEPLLHALGVRTQHADPTLVQLLVKQAEEALVQRKIHADLVQQ